MDPRELRRLYNHPKWPSPYARLVAIKLKLDVLNTKTGERMKRLTHEQALNLLSKRLRLTIPQFLAFEKEDAWRALGSVRYRHGNSISVCPLRIDNPYYQTNYFSYYY
jgi:hypothetical protein